MLELEQRIMKGSTYATVLMTVALLATASTPIHAQTPCDPNIYEWVHCNARDLCRQFVGSTGLIWASECACAALCDEANRRRQNPVTANSVCHTMGEALGGTWFSIIFDHARGDNRQRGTVLCDPRGGVSKRPGGNTDNRPGKKLQL